MKSDLLVLEGPTDIENLLEKGLEREDLIINMHKTNGRTKKADVHSN